MSAERTIIEANAGAAKTTTLALRMAQADHGHTFERCLALTYTDTAARPSVAVMPASGKIGVPAPEGRGFMVAGRKTTDRQLDAGTGGRSSTCVPSLGVPAPERIRPPRAGRRATVSRPADATYDLACRLL